MKNFLTIVGQTIIIMVCGIVAAILAADVITYWAAPIAAYVFGCLLGALVTGVFDVDTAKRAKQKPLSQGYRDAA